MFQLMFQAEVFRRLMLKSMAVVLQCLNLINYCRDHSVLLLQEYFPLMGLLALKLLSALDQAFFQMLM